MAKQRKTAKKAASLLALSMSLAVGATSLGTSLYAFADAASDNAGKYNTDYDSMEEAKPAGEE